MAFCRLGFLRSSSHLQVSFLSLVAVKQNSPILFVATQGIQHERKPSQPHAISIQDLNASYSSPYAAQKTSLISQPNSISAVILESFALDNSHLHCSGLSRDIQEYVCPSRHTNNTNFVILDNIASIASFYDCPVSTVIDKIKAPTIQKVEILEGPGKSSPKMEAKIIMKIRHKKMKKHKLKKLRKRMYFLWSRQKRARKMKRLKIYFKELEEIKAKGENFNAEDFVREQIEKAKKGGYGINVLDSSVGK